MNKILLLGGDGFIGKRFQQEADCYSYDLINGDDIRDKYKLDRLVQNEGFNTIINLAALVGVRDGEEYPDEYFSINVDGLRTVIEVAEKNNARLIHFSSSSVYKTSDQPLREDDPKEPVSIYGITKHAGDLLIKKSNLNYTIIRPFTVLGENGRKGMVLHRWKSQHEAGLPVPFLGDGTTHRGYTYVGDLVRGALMSTFGEFNIGGDQIITLQDMWEIFKSKYPTATREMLPLPSYDVPRSVADTSKAFEEFGWKHETDIREKILEII